MNGMLVETAKKAERTMAVNELSAVKVSWLDDGEMEIGTRKDTVSANILTII